MKNSQNKGFTLIELLVVIAIIGILSGVVLAALTTARTKGSDASIQTELSNMRSQAELYYTSNSSTYGPKLNETACSVATTSNIFGSTTLTGSLKNLLDGVLKKQISANTACAIGGTGETNGSSWAVAVKMLSDTAKSFCVDSAGTSKTYLSGTPGDAIFQDTTLTKCN